MARRRVRDELAAWAEDLEIDLIFFDPPAHFDAAIVGVVHGYGQEPAIVYDQAQVLAAMVKDGMSWEDAEEWFGFNTVGSYLGAATPRFLIEIEGVVMPTVKKPDPRNEQLKEQIDALGQQIRALGQQIKALSHEVREPRLLPAIGPHQIRTVLGDAPGGGRYVTVTYPAGSDTVMSVQPPDGRIETRPGDTQGPYEIGLETGDRVTFAPTGPTGPTFIAPYAGTGIPNES